MNCGNDNYGPRTDPMAGVCCYERKIYQDYDKRIKTQQSFSPVDIYYCYKDAIVSITTTTRTDAGTVTQTGSGAFFGPCLIVTAANLLIYNSASVARVPPAPTGINASRVEKIQVRVSNVNGEGDTYFYDGKLVGFSPTFNIGVIEINNVQTQPCAAPPIKKCPILPWGCSRKTVIGESVVVISNNYDAPVIGVSGGIVVDNLYTQREFNTTSGHMTTPTNNVEVEGIVTDATILGNNIGGPLFDMQGKVIGIITGQIASDDNVNYPGRNWTYAVSEHVARRVATALSCQRNDKKLAGHVKYIDDLLGTYRTYNFGWLGLNSYVAFGPETLNLVPDSKYLKQKGFVVRDVDLSGPLAAIMTDGSILNDTYLITQINGADVGIGAGQIPISSVTMLEIPDMEVVLNYRIGSEKFACPRQVRLQLAAYPSGGAGYVADAPPPYSYTRSVNNQKAPFIAANEEIDRSVTFKVLLDRLLSHITTPSFLQFLLSALKNFSNPSGGNASLNFENVNDQEVNVDEIREEARARGVPEDVINGILSLLGNQNFLNFFFSKIEALLKSKNSAVVQATEPL